MVWWQGVLFILGSSVTALLAGLLLSYVILRIQKRPWPYSWPYFRKSRGATVAKEQVKSKTPDILVEVETNLAISTRSWTGELLPFQTSIWDNNHGEVDSLPAELQEELTEAYADMHLANSIVWLSTDLGRRSEDLDESYNKLRAKIAERLATAMPSQF